MSAPTNDNIANATTISGLSGVVVGTNISASTEAGEPKLWAKNPTYTVPNPGQNMSASNTVWYQWANPYTSSLPYTVKFTTKAISGTHYTNFPTTIQAFSASSNPVTYSFSQINEVPYVDNFTMGEGNGYGAFVAFPANSGSSYFIRVDGKYGKTGEFVLAWDEYTPFELGACDTCPPSLIPGETCLGSVMLTSPSQSSAVQNFTYSGSTIFPSGLYVVRYCKGWYPNINWTAGAYCGGQIGAAPYFCKKNYYWTTNDGIKFFSTDISGSQNYRGFATTYTSTIGYQDVVKQSKCASVTLLNASGSIGMSYTKGNVWPAPVPGPDFCACWFDPDSWNGIPVLTDGGDPNPVFGLYQVTPVIKLAAANGTFGTACNVGYTGSFTLSNLGNVTWESCSVVVQNVGEVTGATQSLSSFFTLPAQSLGGSGTTPTLKFNRVNSAVTPFNLTFNLYILTYAGQWLTGSTSNVAPLTSSFTYTLNPTVATGINNLGLATNIVRASDTISATSSLQFAGFTSGDFWNGCRYTASWSGSDIISASSVTFGNKTNSSFTVKNSFVVATANKPFFTASFQVQDYDGTILTSSKYNFTPLIGVSSTLTDYIYCSTNTTWYQHRTFTFVNNGNAPTVNLIATMASGSADPCLGYATAFPANIGVLKPGQGYTTANYYYTTGSGNITIALSDGAYTYPPVTF